MLQTPFAFKTKELFQKRAESNQIIGQEANKLSFPADSVLACALRALRGRMRRKLYPACQKILSRRKGCLYQDTHRLKPFSPQDQGKPPTHPSGQDFVVETVKEIGHCLLKTSQAAQGPDGSTQKIYLHSSRGVLKPVTFYLPIRPENRALRVSCGDKHRMALTHLSSGSGC